MQPGQTSAGNLDAFVRKYDVNGAELWTRQFGTSEADQASAISTDSSGVHVVGRSGALSEIITTDEDPFVRKYDADGNELWTRQLGGSSDGGAFGVSVDGSGIYVAGFEQGVLPGLTSP